MNIPKSYEALAADLASEKIISKTLQGQKESYMMLADGRKFDLGTIQQRLTVAEQRADVLTEALEGMVEYFPEGNSDGECFSVERANLALGRPNDCIHDWFPDHCLKCGVTKP